jgi:hypothetical protein
MQNIAPGTNINGAANQPIKTINTEVNPLSNNLIKPPSEENNINGNLIIYLFIILIRSSFLPTRT